MGNTVDCKSNAHITVYYYYYHLQVLSIWVFNVFSPQTNILSENSIKKKLQLCREHFKIVKKQPHLCYTESLGNNSCKCMQKYNFISFCIFFHRKKLRKPRKKTSPGKSVNVTGHWPPIGSYPSVQSGQLGSTQPTDWKIHSTSGNTAFEIVVLLCFAFLL